ncbi:hypothetical protein AVEN_137822-1 [Araneus ventricosus]|uniref:Uncharacterized protein n=1 Tax=Araneus ventricosus TaxID=182803 RepID=A0A4Y2M0P8_ARAVE|nr:hypothetical protein AVEN_137822-1 [Araneus ventricosus]
MGSCAFKQRREEMKRIVGGHDRARVSSYDAIDFREGSAGVNDFKYIVSLRRGPQLETVRFLRVSNSLECYSNFREHALLFREEFLRALEVWV